MRNPAFVLLLATAASAQVWQALPIPSAYAMVHDPDRQRVVLLANLGQWNFGTWEWDGVAWLRTAATGSFAPSTTFGHPLLFYDPVRRETVVTYNGQTFAYDGVAWRLLNVGGPPPLVSGVTNCAAYDQLRRVFVHYDVWNATTWEWDGAQWRSIAASVGNIGFFFSGGIGYDPVRGQVVAFRTAPTPATFAFDGVSWTQIPGAPPASFPSQGGAVVTDFLRNRVLVYGGFNNSSLGTVLAWDGTNWQTLGTGPAVDFPSLAPDGNAGFLAFTGETWRFDGVATFTPLELLAPLPQAMVLDRSRNLLVTVRQNSASVPVTWEWDGGHWFDRGTSPSILELTDIVYDEARSTVLGVERNLSLTYTRTYRWTGSSWQLLGPAYQPGFQPAPHLAYDRARQVVVMYSGGTHEWNGADWTLVRTVNTPPPPVGLIFDPVPQRVHMLTQLANGSNMQEWEWNGLDWSLITNNGPPWQSAAKLDRDPRSGNLVLVGAGTWERVGGVWMSRGNGLQYPWGTAPDPATGCLRNWGSNGWSLLRPDLAAGTAYGSGCGAATLLPVGRPAPFDGRFRFDFGHVPTNALVALYGDWHAANVPLAGGCTLLLAQPQPLGSMLANATGFASFLLALPRSAAVIGLDLYCQGLALDPAGPLFGIVSLTGGVRVHVGD